MTETVSPAVNVYKYVVGTNSDCKEDRRSVHERKVRESKNGRVEEKTETEGTQDFTEG
jgi:hypothetical protein